MGKLHELLAVEPDVKASAQAIVSETISVFKKDEHFSGFQKTYHPFRDDGDKIPPEGKLQVTTVREKLDHTHLAWQKLVDVVFQKETANTMAFAPLVIDGETIAENVPATVLLNLESKLKMLKEVYLAAPTLDPVESWWPHTDRAFSFKTEESKTYRTAKVLIPQILVPATDKHPAQVEKVIKDEQVGEYRVVKFSGKLTPRSKSKMLTRIDKLIAAVKSARCRANEADVPDGLTIGSQLTRYLTQGLD